MAEDEKRRDEEGFLTAWSRRKRAAARAEAATVTEAEEDAAEAEAVADVESGPLPDDEPELDADELAALPSIDEISAKTDLQPFMKRGVPEALRKAAMRKVWLSNSLIRDHDDPAVDYAWDWNAPEGVPGAGGVLNKDGVSKMVDDLINRDRPKVDAEDKEGDTAEVAETTSDTDEAAMSDGAPTDEQIAAQSDAPSPLPTESVRRAGQPAPRQESRETRVDESSSDGVPSGSVEEAAPRRHGSAVPE